MSELIEYPKPLYKSADDLIIVKDDAEEVKARKEGYIEFAKIPASKAISASVEVAISPAIEVTTLQEKVADLQSTIDAMTAEKEEGMAEIKQLNLEITAHEVTITNLQAELAAAKGGK